MYRTRAPLRISVLSALSLGIAGTSVMADTAGLVSLGRADGTGNLATPLFGDGQLELAVASSKMQAGALRATSLGGGGSSVSATGSLPWLLLGGLAVGAAVAAGGGGGGDDDGDRTPELSPTLPAPETSPVVPTHETPPAGGLDPLDFETSEYNRDYTLGMINAADRYADGGTGRGTLLAVFDSGADVNHADLAPNVAHSWSYFSNSADVTDYDGHGTHVASKIAGAKNDFGMHGVAFDAKLAIFQNSTWDGAPVLKSGIVNTWADAQRRAAGLGALAINHSWVLLDAEGNERLIREFNRKSLGSYLGSNSLDALQDSVEADMLTIFAAGNGGQNEVSVLAGIPVLFPEFGSHMLAVGAVDSAGRIASFSNRCGIAAEFCLVAPGVATYGALSSDADHAANSFGYMSGTSMAAPHVVGAVGVLASNFPELTGAEISRILRETATDLGEAGVDEVFGNGLLNLENAVAPQGTLTVLSGKTLDAGGDRLKDSWIVGDAPIASALAASLADTDLMVADHYMRGYGVDMGALVASRSSAVDMQGLRAFATVPAPMAAPVDVADGSPFGMWFSESGIDPADGAVWADAQAFGSVYAGLIDALHFSFAGQTPLGTLTLKSAFSEDSSSYAAAELKAVLAGGHSLALEVGYLVENDAMLGTAITGAFGGDFRSATAFARVGSELKMTEGTSMAFSASLGDTAFSSEGILAEGDAIRSSSIGIGLKTTGVLSSGDSFSFGISRPLSIDGGRLVVDAPVAMAPSNNGVRSRAVYRDRSQIDLAASGPVADLQMGYSRPALGGRLNLAGAWRPDTGAGSGFGLAAGYTLKF